AECRPAGEGTRWVDGNDSDLEPAIEEFADQRVDQGTLTRTGGARHTDDVRPSGLRIEFEERGSANLIVVLDVRGEPRQGTLAASQHVVCQSHLRQRRSDGERGRG